MKTVAIQVCCQSQTDTSSIKEIKKIFDAGAILTLSRAVYEAHQDRIVNCVIVTFIKDEIFSSRPVCWAKPAGCQKARLCVMVDGLAVKLEDYCLDFFTTQST